jgi:hypothetical protein
LAKRFAVREKAKEGEEEAKETGTFSIEYEGIELMIRNC